MVFTPFSLGETELKIKIIHELTSQPRLKFGGRGEEVRN